MLTLRFKKKITYFCLFVFVFFFFFVWNKCKQATKAFKKLFCAPRIFVKQLQ